MARQPTAQPAHSARYTGRRPAGTIRIRLATDARGLGRLAIRRELFNVEVIFDRDSTRADRPESCWEMAEILGDDVIPEGTMSALAHLADICSAK